MSLHDWIIFQLVDSRNSGGIETHILNLSSWLKHHGYQTRVIFMKDYGPHPLKQQLAKAGIHWQTSDGWYDLYKQLRHTPSMLATHGYKAGIIGRLLARCAGVPVVSTYHSGDLGEGRLKLYSKLDALSAPLADRIISVSPEIAERLPCKCLQLPNFVQTDKYQPSEGRQIAFVGRLSAEKGPDIFARITQAACQQPATTPVAIYGEGPMRAELEQQYDHLQFYGQVNMQNHWHDIGLLCITSRSEGLPLVALEAMARGIPVASFELGALPQVIEPDTNGWLIPRDNYIQFQKVIQHWLKMDTVARKNLSFAAFQTVRRRFSSDIVGPQVAEIYRQALPALSHYTE